jgi:hypothetical protein
VEQGDEGGLVHQLGSWSLRLTASAMASTKRS